jgi:hypothetical protein
MKRRVRRVWPNKKMSQLLLLHDDARLHTALSTRAAIVAMGCTFLLIVPYNPDLAPSDFLLFWSVKDALRERRSADDEVKNSLCEGPSTIQQSFTRPKYRVPRKSGQILTFIYPYIASISLKYNQQYATFFRSVYFYKLLYMLQAFPPPIIRSTKLYVQRQVLSNQYCCLLLSCSSTGLTIPDAVRTVLCS